MDHLPKPLDGAKIDVRAYAVRTEYEPELFFSLPGTHKLDFRKLVTQGYPEDRNGLKKKKEFLQEWWFFALLAQCLDRRILLEDFKLNNGNRLTTEKLGQFLKEWATTHQVSTESAHDDVKEMRRCRARWALAEAQRHVESHCSMKTRKISKTSICPLQSLGKHYNGLEFFLRIRKSPGVISCSTMRPGDTAFTSSRPCRSTIRVVLKSVDYSPPSAGSLQRTVRV